MGLAHCTDGSGTLTNATAYATVSADAIITEEHSVCHVRNQLAPTLNNHLMS